MITNKVIRVGKQKVLLWFELGQAETRYCRQTIRLLNAGLLGGGG